MLMITLQEKNGGIIARVAAPQPGSYMTGTPDELGLPFSILIENTKQEVEETNDVKTTTKVRTELLADILGGFTDDEITEAIQKRNNMEDDEDIEEVE